MLHHSREHDYQLRRDVLVRRARHARCQRIKACECWSDHHQGRGSFCHREAEKAARWLLSAACNDLACSLSRSRGFAPSCKSARKRSRGGNQEVIKALERAGKSYRFLTVSLSLPSLLSLPPALKFYEPFSPATGASWDRLLPSPPPNPKTPLLPNEIDSWTDRRLQEGR